MIQYFHPKCKKRVVNLKRSYLKYIFALLLFGSNGIVASLIDLSSLQIVLLRTMIGSILLMALFFLTGGRLTLHQKKRDFFFLCISGIAMGTSWMFLYEAYQQIGVSIASLCYYCGPVIVMILSPLLFREKLTMEKVLGFVVVFVGIFLVNGKTGAGESRWGLFCGLMSAVMYAFMVIFNKKAKAIEGMENSMLQLFISFLTVLVFMVLSGKIHFVIPEGSLVPMLVLGLLNTGIGCYFYFSSIRDLPVQTVAICGYLEPLSAVVFSVVFLKEIMSPIQVVGGVLILGGAIFGECFHGKNREFHKKFTNFD